MFKVVIAGGRNFNNYDLLKAKCDELLSKKVKEGKKIVIVSGKAKGADSLGERYAQEKGYDVAEFPADWDTYDKRAGYMRNKQMAEYGDACICFWDGISKGSKHMIDLSKKQGIPVRIVNY